MSDLAGCYAAIAARPDGRGPRDKVLDYSGPGHRSAYAAETASDSLDSNEFETANSRLNRVR